MEWLLIILLGLFPLAGIGLGFCCCAGCCWSREDIERAATDSNYGTDTAVFDKSGTWSANDVFGGGDGYLRTANTNAYLVYINGCPRDYEDEPRQGWFIQARVKIPTSNPTGAQPYDNMIFRLLLLWEDSDNYVALEVENEAFTTTTTPACVISAGCNRVHVRLIERDGGAETILGEYFVGAESGDWDKTYFIQYRPDDYDTDPDVGDLVAGIGDPPTCDSDATPSGGDNCIQSWRVPNYTVPAGLGRGGGVMTGAVWPDATGQVDFRNLYFGAADDQNCRAVDCYTWYGCRDGNYPREWTATIEDAALESGVACDDDGNLGWINDDWEIGLSTTHEDFFSTDETIVVVWTRDMTPPGGCVGLRLLLLHAFDSDTDLRFCPENFTDDPNNRARVRWEVQILQGAALLASWTTDWEYVDEHNCRDNFSVGPADFTEHDDTYGDFSGSTISFVLDS